METIKEKIKLNEEIKRIYSSDLDGFSFQTGSDLSNLFGIDNKYERFFIESESGNSSYDSFVVYGERWETDSEYEERLIKYEEMEKLIKTKKEREEQEEFELYKRLKKKYGDIE